MTLPHRAAFFFLLFTFLGFRQFQHFFLPCCLYWSKPLFFWPVHKRCFHFACCYRMLFCLWLNRCISLHAFMNVSSGFSFPFWLWWWKRAFPLVFPHHSLHVPDDFFSGSVKLSSSHRSLLSSFSFYFHYMHPPGKEKHEGKMRRFYGKISINIHYVPEFPENAAD